MATSSNPTQLTKAKSSDAPYAALDLGSNSFHLLVAMDRPGRLQPIDKVREMVRLGTGVAQTGEINRASKVRALRTLERIGQRIRSLPQDHVRIVGTNALRVASNSKEFIDAAERLLGHTIEVISGREEARLIYLGALNSLEDYEDEHLVVDIGGGSTEIIFGEKLDPKLMESLRMGCISVSEQWFGNGKITPKRMRRAINHARQEFEPVAESFRSLGCRSAIGTSGTILATQYAIGRSSDQSINPTTLNELENQLVRLKKVSNITKLVNEDRAPLFPGGLAIVQALFGALTLDTVRAATGALREGVLYDLLGRAHNNDIRETSVQDLINRFNIDREHGHRVSATALSLWEQIKEDWTIDTPEHKTMLRWAALLHEIGMDVSHASYHQHGGYLLRNFDLAGFSVRDQVLLASIVQAHRRIYPKDLSTNPSVSKLIILLRLAVVFKRGRTDELLPNCVLKVIDTGLQVSIERKWLKRHKLTQLDLEQEVEFLRFAPFQLSLVSVRS